ncbi:transcription factor 7-like 1 [Archocentrus centrarchus]|uniref:transcription factor 7-like 1 n=1 Tax=Archocentrus centrarchus TaxID=63155 RepID=UPI0011EA34BE|nr:transcription factor 7-like 1 [Archocentrus centrarchus]
MRHFYGLRKNLVHQWPVHAIPTSATAPPAAANPCNNILQIPDSMLQYLRPVGVLNGVFVYDINSTAAPLNTPAPKKRKRQDEQGGEYIKKPPNAFMMFLKEQRPKVKSEMKISGSAAVNAVVGERWKSLSKEQQDTYYEQTEQQRRLHTQKHPDWSSKDNYGKKRKRTRRSTCSTGKSRFLGITGIFFHVRCDENQTQMESYWIRSKTNLHNTRQAWLLLCVYRHPHQWPVNSSSANPRPLIFCH